MKLRYFCFGWWMSVRFWFLCIVRYWWFCCFFMVRCCVWICFGFRRLEDFGCCGVCWWCWFWMKWFVFLVFWKVSIVCLFSFCMEWVCGLVRVCNCGLRIWILIMVWLLCGRVRVLRIGFWCYLRVWYLVCVSSCCVYGYGGWRIRLRVVVVLCFLMFLSGSICVLGIFGCGFGFLCSICIWLIYGVVLCVVIICMIRFFSVFLNVL